MRIHRTAVYFSLYLLILTSGVFAQRPIPGAPQSAGRPTSGYVVLQDQDEDSLVWISVDGKSQATIARGAAGLGFVVDSNGDYIIAARSALLRVTAAGVVSQIALAPPTADWGAVVINKQGEYILADAKQPVVWAVAADGKSFRELARYPGNSYDAEGHVAILLDASGNYFLFSDSQSSSSNIPFRFVRINAAGLTTAIPVRGMMLPNQHVDRLLTQRDPAAVVADGNGGFLFTEHISDYAVFHLAEDGQVTRFAELPLTGANARCGYVRGLTRNLATQETIVSLPNCNALVRISPDGLDVRAFAQAGKLTGKAVAIATISRK